MIYYSENPQKSEEIDLSFFDNLKNSYISVTQLNTTIKTLLDEAVGFIRVKGEVSSITFHSSGHIYITLKDENASVDAVVFKNLVRPDYKKIKIGDTLNLGATVNVYVKGGKYSLNVMYLQKEGIGDIYTQFLDLKEKLEKEGLFNETHKKAIPASLKKIALITSETGAALKDFLHISEQRFPNGMEFIIVPTLMQGNEAVSSILESLKAAENMKEIDLILITRGGGAYEDLECFNNETLAKAIYHCEIPTVSAIGHERDFTICDFVCDLRLSTPSHAAEVLIPSKQEIISKLDFYRESLNNEIERKKLLALNKIGNYNPLLLHQLIEYKFLGNFHALERSHNSLHSAYDRKISPLKDNLEKKYIQLSHLNPLHTFSKGYAFVQKENQKPVTSIKDLHLHEQISLSFKDGKIKTQITEMNPLNKE